MADKKISQLTGASTLTGTEELPIVQGGQTVKTTTQDIADLAGGGGVKKYVALLSPGADPFTDPPFASTIFENTMDGNITFGIDGNGTYWIENINLVDPTKVFVLFTGSKSGKGNGNVESIGAEIYEDFEYPGIKLWFSTFESGNYESNWGAPIFVEIRVYP